MESKITRRSFLKGSIVVALGAMGATTLGACTTPAASSAPDKSSETSDAAKSSSTVTLHRGYGIAHGDNCFSSVVVATLDDGTILAVSVDDYQFMDADSAGIKGVPNSDGPFGENYAPGKVLMAKGMNNEAYSARMKEKAQSTQPWRTSMGAIEAYCVGKKATDLTRGGADAVSGATLVDTPNYVKLIAEIAEDDAIVTKGMFEGDGSDLKVGRINASAHGDKIFTEVVALVQGDVLVAASIDEFQFMDASTQGLVFVPNSDARFGEGYADGVALMSKSANSDVYSGIMKEKAQATTPWLDSMTAIESFVAGKKIGEIKADGPDAVSGATLVDTAGYVEAAVMAAKAA